MTDIQYEFIGRLFYKISNDSTTPKQDLSKIHKHDALFTKPSSKVQLKKSG